MIGIYKITNNVNKKVYIGQSKNIRGRWKDHRTRFSDTTLKESNSLLYKAMRKYGLENFSFEVIEECNVEELNEKEKYWIKYYNSFIGFKNSNGYNMTLGGQDGATSSILNYSTVEEIKKLLSSTRISQEEIAIQYNVNQATISLINTGVTWYDEDLVYPLRNKKFSQEEKKHNYCITCGKEISLSAIKCESCAKKDLRVCERPSREILKNLIRTTPFTIIGKQFNVSDNAIRKWCDNYNLPRKVSEIKKYSDEEWEKI